MMEMEHPLVIRTVCVGGYRSQIFLAQHHIQSLPHFTVPLMHNRL